MPILMRTALFVPGNRPDRIEKAFNTEADVVIIDLEDAVPISQKEISRSNVREKVAQFSDRVMLVRINALGSPFVDGDLEEAIVEGVNGIVLPKVEKADDVHDINKLLLEVEKKRSLPEGSILLFPFLPIGRVSRGVVIWKGALASLRAIPTEICVSLRAIVSTPGPRVVGRG